MGDSDIEIIEEVSNSSIPISDSSLVGENEPSWNSSEDEAFPGRGKQSKKKTRSSILKVKRDEMSRLFNHLQQVVTEGMSRPESVKRIHVVSRALKLCLDLNTEESKLLVELELLMQQNWKLKRRITHLTKQKKKKLSATLTRRTSNVSLTPNKQSAAALRRLSLDESKIKDVVSTPPKSSVAEDKQVAVTPNKSRKKHKRRSGISEEEKEFFMLEEKIDDLANEVESLWNDVKEEEEWGEGEEDNDERDYPKLIAAALAEKEKENSKNKSQKNAPSGFKTNSLLSKSQVPPKNPRSLLRRSLICDNDSSDEDRLVIDEEASQRSCSDDVFENLQAVDDLCRKLVPDDEPSPSVVEPPLENKIPERKRRLARKAAPRDLTDIIIIDD